MQQNETMGGGVVARAQSMPTGRLSRVQQELASLREMRVAGRRIQDEVIDAVVARVVKCLSPDENAAGTDAKIVVRVARVRQGAAS